MERNRAQADLLKADIDRLRDDRHAALLNREEYIRAKVRAMADVEQSDAGITNAQAEADKLASQIDDLEALAALIPPPRETA